MVNDRIVVTPLFQNIQEKNSSYTAMPTATQKILSASWNVQFVVFNTKIYVYA
jgi:hypothetical protein